MAWSGARIETVETVLNITADLGHRAEAAVLMRSLRVVGWVQIPLLRGSRTYFVRARPVSSVVISIHDSNRLHAMQSLAGLPRLDPDDEVADGDLLIGHDLGALFAW